MKIRSTRLTTCKVAADGGTVELGLVDHVGMDIAVQLSFEQAEAVVMTLPHLLARALKNRTANQNARYVFGLSEWTIESARSRDCLIATLRTMDGFEVSFCIPFEVCAALGRSLQREAEEAVEEVDAAATTPSRIGLN